MDHQTGYCKVCPGKCFWDHHKNGPIRFESYTEEVTRTIEDLKKRYYEAASKKTAAEDVTAGLKKDLDNLYLTVFGMLRKAHRIIHRLEELDKTPNPLSEIQYIELLIVVENTQKKQGFERRIKALENVLEQAKKFTEMKDEGKVMQMLKDAADHCRNKLQFW
jgi:fibronectin type 3 domain-containing protein